MNDQNRVRDFMRNDPALQKAILSLKLFVLTVSAIFLLLAIRYELENHLFLEAGSKALFLVLAAACVRSRFLFWLFICGFASAMIRSLLLA